MHLLVCVCMHPHCVRERCAAVCGIASERSRHDSKQQTAHVSMPPARAQEHKRRKAHTYQNTTHGVASCVILRSIRYRYLVSIVHYIYLFFFCWYPMRLRNIC